MFQFFVIVIISVLAVLDQLVKHIVTDYVFINGSKKFLFGLFQLTYVENTGAAFSSFSNSTLVLSVLTSIIIAVCLVYLFMRKSPSIFVTVSLILIVSGGIGNMIDRISNGYVIDFIEPLFIKFAVFNIADCFITVGAFMLAGYELISGLKKPKNDSGRGDKSA